MELLNDDKLVQAPITKAPLNMCVPMISNGQNHNYAAMIVLLVVTTLIQLFDIYLDLRQKRKYLLKDLPEQFHEGFKLSDEVDQRLKKGKYAVKTDVS
jgi:hypothetical protein